MKNRLRVSKGLVMIALLLSIVACKKSVDVMKLIDEGEYNKAVESFDASKYDKEELSALSKGIKERIDSKLLSYANDETELEDLEAFLTMAYQLGIDGTSTAVSDAKLKKRDLTNSKNAYKEAEELMQDHDYAAAFKKLKDVIETDAKYKDVASLQQECIDQYIKSIGDAEADYINKDDLEGAESFLQSELKNHSFDIKIRDYILGRQEKLAISIAMREVEEFTSENDYYSAFNTLKSIKTSDEDDKTKVDEKIAKLQDEYKQFVASTVDQYFENKEYSEAGDFLSKQMNTAKECGLTDLINERLLRTEIKSVIVEAEESVRIHDIASAITMLNDFMDEKALKEDDELDEYLKDISAEYVDLILERVNELEERKNYAMALKVLADAKGVFASPSFSEKVEEIKGLKPIYLYDIKCIDSNHMTIRDSVEGITDNIGNEYEPGNLFSFYSGYSEKAYADFYVGHQYKYLTGVVAVGDNSTGSNVKFTIEGDGKELYSKILSKNTLPTKIEVDISNVDTLRIKSAYDSGRIMYYITVILSDFQLSE